MKNTATKHWQIKELYNEAVSHGDMIQAAIAHMALYGRVSEHMAISPQDRGYVRRVYGTKGKAWLECEAVFTVRSDNSDD